MPTRQSRHAGILPVLATVMLAHQASAAKPVTLWAFGGLTDDGQNPAAPLIADASGALYGTTDFGGSNGDGTAFKLTPPGAGQTGWGETQLHAFVGGSDGAHPVGSGLVAGRSGILYGATSDGGGNPCGCGTVFALAPPAAGQTTWAETVLYSFTGGADGSTPQSTLLYRKGILYGTTTLGGNTGCSGSGCGTVFRLAPPRSGQTGWTETVLYTFGGDVAGDGSDPIGGVIADQAGALYGTTVNGGGPHNQGTVFRLTPPSGGSGPWTETLLYSFGAFVGDAAVPYAGLAMDTAGALYGTGQDGGNSDDGAVFRLTPPAVGQTAWTESVLHSFCSETGCADGQSPYYAGVTLVEGKLYGTTYYGGRGDGVVYSLSPPAAGGTIWSEQVLAEFNSADGGYPEAGLIERKGTLYGTTVSRAEFDAGEVFKLHIPPAALRRDATGG